MEEKERYVIDRFYEDIFDTKKEYYPSNQTICEIINKQDKRIKELEEQTYPAYKREHQRRAYLENIEVPKLKKRIKELEKKLDNARQKDIIIRQNCRQGYIKDLEEMNNLREENQQLKQQLHDLPNNILGEIKQQLFNHFKVKNIEEYEKLSLIDALFTADTVIEILDTILKKLGG